MAVSDSVRAVQLRSPITGRRTAMVRTFERGSFSDAFSFMKAAAAEAERVCGGFEIQTWIPRLSRPPVTPCTRARR